VKVGDRTLGLVTVISQSKSHFNSDLVDLLASLVDGLGVLVENSMLHDKTEKAHEELQLLAEELSHSNQQLEQFADILEERVELRTQELVTARERVLRSEKLAMIGQLSGGIAHDLRNPLNAIKNGAELVKRKINAGPSIENSAMITECLEIIDSEITDANEIITGLLSCGSNKQLSFSSIRIGDVIQDCFGSFVLNENIVLSITINTDLPPVLGDASQLTRVLQNLAGNAQDAMEAGGRLSISAQHRDQFVEIVITDTGGGIDAENIDRVFEPLFSDKPHGTGLGLAICHEIIDKHKGAISVESKIGTGTSFTIQIPVTNSENSDLAA